MDNKDFVENLKYFKENSKNEDGGDNGVDKKDFLKNFSQKEIDNLFEVSDKLLRYTNIMNNGDQLSGDQLAEVVGLQIAIDVYKNLLGVAEMENKEFFSFI